MEELARHPATFHGHGGDADGYLTRLGYTRHINVGYFLVITAFQPRTIGRMAKLLERRLLTGATTPRQLDAVLGPLL